MDVIFRTDASLDIGTGHVMRCLTLAEAMRDKGAKCRFVCRGHPGNMLEFVRQRGFEAFELPVSVDDMERRKAEAGTIPAYAAWLGSDWASDAQQTQAAVGDSMIDWLIVDHYALGVSWEQAMRSACRHIMVIDDLADREHNCDLLIDQNLGREPTDYENLVPLACKILTGPQYALLRPEFATLRRQSLVRRSIPQLKRLLVSMGGVDKDNATCEVLEALKACRLPEKCRISIVMGSHAPGLAQVRNAAVQMPWRSEVLVNVRDMARLMAESDLAIGAAGSTTWERCCMGLPTILVILADNQRDGAVAMEAAGAASLIGETAFIRQNLPARLEELLSGNNLQLMRQNCLALVDGKGTDRAVKALMDAYD